MLINVGWLYLNLKEQFREVSANERRAFNLLPIRTELTISSANRTRVLKYPGSCEYEYILFSLYL